MKFLRKFNEHTSYEAEVNVGGDFKIPNVSYCKDVKDVHFNPYNLIKFYVGEVTGTTPQTVSIYTDGTNHVDFKVSEGEGNKWYSYVLPKDKVLCWINGDSVKNVNVKADISYNYNGILTSIIPNSVVEASFKGSNTSNVTDMSCMFDGCRGLTLLDLSGWNTSNVTDMSYMFNSCSGLTSLDLSGWNTSKVTRMNSMFNECSGLETLDLSGWNTSNVTVMDNMFSGCNALKIITMKGCSEATINKVTSVKPSSATTIVTK